MGNCEIIKYNDIDFFFMCVKFGLAVLGIMFEIILSVSRVCMFLSVK